MNILWIMFPLGATSHYDRVEDIITLDINQDQFTLFLNDGVLRCPGERQQLAILIKVHELCDSIYMNVIPLLRYSDQILESIVRPCNPLLSNDDGRNLMGFLRGKETFNC